MDLNLIAASTKTYKFQIHELGVLFTKEKAEVNVSKVSIYMRHFHALFTNIKT